MNLLYDIINFNKSFVSEKKYEEFETSMYPNKKVVVLTCMDTRLLELLPKAMAFKNGDVKLIKNAGAVITSQFGSVMRSLIVAVYEMQVEEIYIVGHHECGMSGMDAHSMLYKFQERGIKEETLSTLEYSGIDLRAWLEGFGDVKENVKQSATLAKNHPLMPEEIPVHGLVICPHTGKLEVVVDGYEF